MRLFCESIFSNYHCNCCIVELRPGGNLLDSAIADFGSIVFALNNHRPALFLCQYIAALVARLTEQLHRPSKPS